MNAPDLNGRPEWSDAEYVESARNGCPDHFRVLVQRYQKPLFSYLSSRLGNTGEAEEATQESFVRAFFSLKNLRKPESFYCWLLGIGGRVAKEQSRAWKRGQREREAAQELMTQAEPAESDDDYPLEEAIGSLPETYRQVILLRYYEGLTCQEMARELRTPLGTVTKTLSRAYGLLREQLQARTNSVKTVNH